MVLLGQPTTNGIIKYQRSTIMWTRHFWHWLRVLMLLVCSLEYITGFDLSAFPSINSTLPKVPVRVDTTTGQPVSRGRLSLLHVSGGKHHVADLKRILQCSAGEPSLNQHTGSLSLLDMIPLNHADQLLLMVTYIHTRCWSWVACQEKLKQWKASGVAPRDVSRSRHVPLLHPPRNNQEEVYLLRVDNQSLYLDWPWDNSEYQRIPPRHLSGPHNQTSWHKMFLLWHSLLQRVDDMPNSVFFFAPTSVTFPWNAPFPFFSEIAKYGGNQMPWPWAAEFMREHELTLRVVNDRKRSSSKAADTDNITDEEYSSHLGLQPWDQRINKALLVTTYQPKRHILIELARKFPSLLDASVSFDENAILRPVNPTSSESIQDVKSVLPDDVDKAFVDNSFGGGTSVLHFRSKHNLNVGEYKYVIVPMAEGEPSSSNRLLHYLAHCRCVVLLQTSGTIHHISARLKPWVHFVPISYSGADAAEKITWLQAHDDIAQQIADNGYNFGKSYLRLEDYYCYALTALERTAALTKHIADTSFFPIKVFPHESHQHAPRLRRD